MVLAVDDESRSYTLPPEQRGYYELAVTIIRTAVEDYQRARKSVLRNKNDEGAYDEMMSVRTFFLSDFFEALSGIENPYDFLARLDSQIDAEFASGKKRKRKKITVGR